MFGIPSLYVGIGAVVGAILLVGVAFVVGYTKGGAAERQAALERTVDVLRDRKITDEKVRNLNDDGLCRALGGVPVDGACQ